MNLLTKIATQAVRILMVGVVAAGCQKMDRPVLGDYPQDLNPPGGPLKFYAALDGASVDSIRARFATDNDVTYVDGVKGKAATFDMVKKGYIVYPSANDFGAQTDFTVSLWINPGGVDKKDHVNADGILAFASSSNFWGNITLFADHEASTSDSMVLKVVLNNGGENSNFIGYEGANRLPHMYDGNWHHLAVTYNATSLLYTLYVDGAQFDQKTVTPVKFENASVLVVGGFQQAGNIKGNYKDNSWMSPFPGAVDQVKLYGAVLSAADVAALYASKS